MAFIKVPVRYSYAEYLNCDRATRISKYTARPDTSYLIGFVIAGAIVGLCCLIRESGVLRPSDDVLSYIMVAASFFLFFAPLILKPVGKRVAERVVKRHEAKIRRILGPVPASSFGYGVYDIASDRDLSREMLPEKYAARDVESATAVFAIMRVKNDSDRIVTVVSLFDRRTCRFKDTQMIGYGRLKYRRLGAATEDCERARQAVLTLLHRSSG